MMRTTPHGNGWSATLLGSLGRLALGVVLGLAVCLAFSCFFVAGCGEQKDQTPGTAQETAAPPVATSTPTPETAPVATPETPAAQVTHEKPAVTSKTPAVAKAAPTPKPAPAPVAAAPAAPQEVVLAVGTVIQGTLQSTVSTDKSGVGDAVTLSTSSPVVAEGRTVIPAGAVVHGRVTHVRSAGRMKGAAELTVRFTELEVGAGERVAITCDPLRRVSKGDGRETATEIGAGAVVGGALGGVLGGKDDVLKGVAIGAAVGTGVAAGTKGDQIVLPAGQSVKVTLASPLTLTPKS